MTSWLVGIDSGGTFTDLIAQDIHSGRIVVAKVPSVPHDPSEAVLNGLGQLAADGVDPGDIGHFVHGTTVATNAVLEGKGARTGLLITEGFRAVYEARVGSDPQSLSELLDPHYVGPPLLVPQRLTKEIGERVSSVGDVLRPLDEEHVRAAVADLRELGIVSVAVCYLFSFVDDRHERRTEELIAEAAPEMRVSLSSKVLPTIREYQRLSTTVVDAYVGPVVQRYLDRLADRLVQIGVTTPQVYVAQSNGGLVQLNLAGGYAAQTLLSGPAGGVVAGAQLAADVGEPNIVTFDMGGTSSDICVVLNGSAEETTNGSIAGQDVGLPMLRVRTLGAGGGTIARIGKSGLLEVGPESAGAQPGPACYGRGGSEPTVTDANLVLGILGESSLLGGAMHLDRNLAVAAFEPIADRLQRTTTEAAVGVLRLINNKMAVSIRLALNERGQDPRRLALVGFGGAGPCHAAMLARMVGIPRVLVPVRPGLNSATGLLQTNVRHTYLRSAAGVLAVFSAKRVDDIFADLEFSAHSDSTAEGIDPASLRLRRFMELRYPHQGYEIAVPVSAGDLTGQERLAIAERFAAMHRELYGQSAELGSEEVVTFRLVSEAVVTHLRQRPLRFAGPVTEPIVKSEREVYDADCERFVCARVYDRASLFAGSQIAGPAVIEQFDSTTFLSTEQTCSVHSDGTLIIETGV